jgi:hypothetical protein
MNSLMKSDAAVMTTDQRGEALSLNCGAPLDSFASAVMAIASLEMLLVLWSGERLGPPRPVVFFLALGFGASLCLRLCWTSAISSAAFVATALFAVVVEFPATPNHHYLLAALAVGILIAGDRRSHGAGFVEENVRFVVGSALGAAMIWSGLQKAIWGAYDQGEYFAVAIASGTRFADILERLLPADEIARLSSLGPPTSGRGPYVLLSPSALWVARSVPCFEVGIGVALLFRRSRRIACLVGACALIAIEVVAREFFFGLLCLLCFGYLAQPSARTARRQAFAVIVVGVVLLAIRLVAPGFVYY